ncbi:ABC transporter substrate-binding protein [Streptomyces sp. TRM 70351]|uniref:ABC transporter substrate-binding protein n=1 Tax=Streptomyces sp. TRM 70351 TaxID=3116552 RepID=UPI002E7B6C1E|nr:ABC transporter substrate-binding protein [Streptomyces sp. TRM 70351]MEE1928187.1 ABC transporter substrate-binding protein [Streptomyces sp. TRM 70351]
MHRRTRRSSYRLSALGLAAVLGTSLLAGCASDEGGSTGGGDSSDEGKTELTVGLFGTFGFLEAGLYEEYERLNPDITIKQTVVERNENYYPQLLTRLASNSGLADVQAIEVANVAEVVQTQADKFMDLGQADGVRKDDWFDWKWQQGTTADGKTIALGTDIGPMAICYRKDHFEAAGLPTDRAEVSELWAGDWQKYLDAGRDFQENGPDDVSWVDSAGGVYNAAISSYESKYYDESGEVIYKENPDVQEAWDVATAAGEAGMTKKLEQFSKPWDQAMNNGTFATISCPAWMLGYIQDKAGDKGKDLWDVADAPKPGNWGGSFLGVPESAKNKEEAAKFVAWLTSPTQQAKLFEERGSFPSAPKSYETPEVAEATHEYFANAPIGEIFSRAAENIPTQIIGPKDQIIQDNIGRAGVRQVEVNGLSPDEAWEEAVKAVDNAIDK